MTEQLNEIIENEEAMAIVDVRIEYRFDITPEIWAEYTTSSWYDPEADDQLVRCAEYYYCSNESELDCWDEEFTVKVDY